MAVLPFRFRSVNCHAIGIMLDGISTREDLSADPADRRRRTLIALGYG
jgi:hypothetical protein